MKMCCFITILSRFGCKKKFVPIDDWSKLHVSREYFSYLALILVAVVSFLQDNPSSDMLLNGKVSWKQVMDFNYRPYEVTFDRYKSHDYLKC